MFEKAVIRFTEETPLKTLFWAWILGNVIMGFVYFFATKYSGYHLLAHNNIPLTDDFNGLLDSIYFSFTAASTLGFGDIIPYGNLRLLSVFQACTGLILITLVISKFVSKRQEDMLQKIYHSSFEDRLHSLRASIYHFRQNIAEINAKMIKKSVDSTEMKELINLQLLSFYTHSLELYNVLNFRDELKELEGEKLMLHFSLAIRAMIDCLSTAQEHHIEFENDSDNLLASVELIRTNLLKICNVIEEKHYRESVIKFVQKVRSRIEELDELLSHVS